MPPSCPSSTIRTSGPVAEFTPIDTPRLRLRDWREGDVAPFARDTNTPEVMRWLGGTRTGAEMRELVEKLGRWQAERGFTFWAVERREDAALIGFCGIKIADTAGSPIEGDHEIGWRLREADWGKGYAREAAEATLDFAFHQIGAPHVVAITFIENEASWGLMERLGMIRRPDLDYVDHRFPDYVAIVYRIAREEWR